MKKINELIDEIKQLRARYNLSIPGPANETAIKRFSDSFQKRFGIITPKEYQEFLKICDGLSENGLTIYSSFNHEENGVELGIFELNDSWHEQDVRFEKHIYFADGDQDLYIYDNECRQYQLLDRYCGDVIEIFTSFEKMLEYILTKMKG